MSDESDALGLLKQLRDGGIGVVLDGQDLVCTGPLTDEMAQQLRALKPQVTALLRAMAPRSAPTIRPDPGARFQPFPLNENQQAYWLGRDAVFEAGQVGIQVYVELSGDLDCDRLSAAWLRVVAHHDMLRARILPDGRQQVQPGPPQWQLPVTDLRKLSPDEARARLGEFRQAATDHCADPQCDPGWDLRAVLMPQGDCVLLVHIDCWALDGRSLQIIAADLARLYHDLGAGLPATDLQFRDYALAMQAVQEGPAYAEALTYWQGRVPLLSGPPRVPTRAPSPGSDSGPASGARMRFHRHDHRLTAASAARLRQAARQRGLTLSAVLIGCYAEVLARWSGQPRFTINIPRWNRHPLHPETDQVAGEFATFTMLEVDTASHADLAGRFAGLQRQLAQDMQQGLVSGVRVLREWRRANGSGPEAMIPFVFTHEPDAPGGRADGRDSAWLASFGRIAPVVRSLTQTPQVWIDAQYHELDKGMLLSWDAQDERFPESMVAEMFAAFVGLVERLADQPDSWAGGHGIALPPGQMQRRDAANATARPVDLPPLRQVLRDLGRVGPDAPALVDQAGTLSRGQLAHAAAALARDLAARGIGPADAVAVLMEKGAGQVVAALAIAALRAVCVPVAPDTPPERLARMLELCDARLILSLDEAEAGSRPCLRLDRGAFANACSDDGAVDWPIPDGCDDDDGLHAILFTSGSTGTPKGVMLRHDGLRNVIADGLKRFGLDMGSRFLSVTPFHHDMAQFDLFASLWSGGLLVLPDPALRRDPAHWLQLAARHQVSFWNSVPAMMGMLLDYCGTAAAGDVRAALSGLRHVTLGGDWIATDTVTRLAALAPQAQLWSFGGPTETTIWNICHRVLPQDALRASIPYGRPIANSGYAILDPRGDDCPDWVAGEMCSTGLGVSPGYLGDAQPDAFAPHPVSGARMYRTGDLGRYLPDGSIEFLGRVDNQVNLNGYRLELEEIETCLTAHPAVLRAVAVPQRQGDLVRGVHVWVQLQPGCNADPAVLAGLRDHLRHRLPPQMQPNALYPRGDWPLTATGKIDRRALAAERPPRHEVRFVPSTETEILVARAWQEVLGRPLRHRDAGFFAEGGDSIAAIRLYGLLLAGRVPGASVTSIFRAPTFAALVNLIDSAPAPEAPPDLLQRVPRDRARYPATTAQARLWLDEALADQPGLYTLSFELDLAGDCAPSRIGAALNQLVAAWETLRTGLVEDEQGAIWQIVHAPWPLTVATGEDLDRLRREAPRQTFDLGLGRNLRAILVRTGPDRQRLLLTTHHAFVDGWSFNLLLQDLALALDGRPVPTRPLQPVDFAVWEQETGKDLVAGDLQWWRRELDRMPGATELAAEGPRGPARSATTEVALHRLKPSVARQMRLCARDLGVTDFQFCLTAFALLLRAETGPGPLLIGTHVALRDRPGLEALPGMMVNNLPLLLDLSEASGFADAAGRVAAAFSAAWQHGHAGFQHIAALRAGPRDRTRHPLYGIAFTHESMTAEPVRAGGLTMTPLPAHVARGALDMDLSMAETADGGLLLKAAYRSDLFSSARVTALLARLGRLIRAAAQNPQATPGRLGPSGDAEDAAQPVAIFDAQVARMPGGAALLDGSGATLASYGDLSRESWRIAAALAARGVGRGASVAVMLPRGPDMVAAMLAVWRIGGHFVALSPDQPRDRVSLVLEDAAPAAVIGTREVPQATLSPEDWAAQQVHPALIDALARQPADPVACLIYTSGTTGRPNGVEFTRRALMNRLEWQWRALPYAPDERCVARTAVEFGDYPAEIFGPLLAAVPVALIDPLTARDPRALADAVAVVGARRLLVVPSLLDLLLETHGADSPLGRMPGLRMILTSGEALPPRLAAQLFAQRPDMRLLNFYGSSETGADATMAELTPGCPEVVVGLPLDNIGVHVVDHALQPCAAGQAGELLVSGDCLARGYRNAPALTAGRFLIWRGMRVFRTGDLGVMEQDGRLRLLGRADRRVKIRGQRIELDEVQQVLCAQPGVEAAAVTTIDGALGLEIVALICGAEPDGLRAGVAQRLPAAAIPSRIRAVDQLPRTPGGKLDYQAVRRMFDAAGPQPLPPLQGPQLRLAALWQEVLGHAPGDARADFFDMGGHSLAAARLAGRVRREFGGEWSVRLIFDHPVLAEMAAQLPPPTPRTGNDDIEEMLI